MRIDRAVLGAWVPRFALWQLALLCMYCVADAAQLRPDRAFVPWHLYPLRMPSMLFQSLPLASAAATAHTITSMRRSGEWLAARACGLSAWRIGAPMLVVAALLAAAGFELGDSVVPGCASAFRAARGGDPPGAVAMPALSAAWRVEPARLVRTAEPALVVSFPPQGPPTIERVFGGERPRTAAPPPSDLPMAALAVHARRSADPLAYQVERVFRPVTASSTLLVCWLMLALMGGRDLGPRAAALVCSLGCLGSYGVVAASFNLALAGVLAPVTAGCLAAGALAAAASVGHSVWRQ